MFITSQNLNDADLWNLWNLLTRNGSDRQVVNIHFMQLMWTYFCDTNMGLGSTRYVRSSKMDGVHSYGHVLVITGYKWDYTIYKCGYKYL